MLQVYTYSIFWRPDSVPLYGCTTVHVSVHHLVGFGGFSPFDVRNSAAVNVHITSHCTDECFYFSKVALGVELPLTLCLTF